MRLGLTVLTSAFLFLAACGTDDIDFPGVDTEPTATESPSPTATPQP